MIATRQPLTGRNRYQARRRRLGKFLQTVGQGPQNQTQPRRCGLQKQRHENRELAKPDAVLAQRATRVLIQLLDLFSHFATRDDPKVLDHAKGKAPRQPAQFLVPAQVQQRLEQRGHLAVNKVL